MKRTSNQLMEPGAHGKTCGLLFLLFFVCWPASLVAQETGTAQQASAPLQQRVTLLKLENEGLLLGIAKLNTLTRDVGFSVETIPGTPTSAPPPSPKFTAQIEGASLEEGLNWLCRLDPRYTWRGDGSTVNVFPRASIHDQDYLFNRKLSQLVLHEVSKPMEAVSKVVQPVSKPSESLVSWQGVQNFSKPWTASFSEITVREALNRIAQQLGPGYGWLAEGNAEVRIFSFHAQLRPASDTRKVAEPQ